MDKIITQDTPSILDSDDMVGEAAELLSSLPDSGIEGKVPVEELEEQKKVFWKAYLTNGTSLQENFNIDAFIKNYVAEHGSADVEGIKAALPDEKAGRFYKTHDEQLMQHINKAVALSSVRGSPATPVEPPKPFSVDDLTNDLARELTSDSDEVEAVLSAADSANDKFDTIRAVARTILQGKGIKHHAFIYGDPGCGKSSHYDEKIPVRMDDAIAEAYEAWLESRQK